MSRDAFGNKTLPTRMREHVEFITKHVGKHADEVVKSGVYALLLEGADRIEELEKIHEKRVETSNVT
jgi:hypothetical protein